MSAFSRALEGEGENSNGEGARGVCEGAGDQEGDDKTTRDEGRDEGDGISMKASQPVVATAVASRAAAVPEGQVSGNEVTYKR